MSHIFEGLQRLEHELCDGSGPTPSGVKELLRQAECRAVSKNEVPIQTEPDATESANYDKPINVRKMALVSSKPEGSPVECSVPDQRVASPDQFQSLKISLTSESRLPCITDSESPAAEAFRLMAVRLRHLRRDRPFKTLLITSTVSQEGKSMVAANLACSLTLRTQQRTLLLEGDLRRPCLTQMFGLERKPGLSEWLENERSLITTIYHLEGPNVWLLPAGSARSNALELLQSGNVSVLMDQLTALFNWIVIDSPPVLPLADTSVWMRLADGILLTTRQGVTERKQLQKGLDAIEPAKLIGALVNSSHTVDSRGYYYSSTSA